MRSVALLSGRPKSGGRAAVGIGYAKLGHGESYRTRADLLQHNDGLVGGFFLYARSCCRTLGKLVGIGRFSPPFALA